PTRRSSDLLANDRDPDGGTLSIASLTNATHGTVAIQSGKVLYTPTTGYLGADSFTYTLSDGQGGTSVGTVSVTVGAPPNQPPVATADRKSAAQDTTALIGVLANDRNTDGGTMSIASVTTATGGPVSALSV